MTEDTEKNTLSERSPNFNGNIMTEEKLIAASKKALAIDESGDKDLLEALAAARAKALSNLPQENESSRSRFARGLFSIGLTGAVAATFFIAFVFWQSPADHLRDSSTMLMADFELMQSDAIDIVEEEIDFYLWLEETSGVEES